MQQDMDNIQAWDDNWQVRFATKAPGNSHLHSLAIYP